MLKKFEVNRTKIKGGCQLRTKAAPKESWNNLTLEQIKLLQANKAKNNIPEHLFLVN